MKAERQLDGHEVEKLVLKVRQDLAYDPSMALETVLKSGLQQEPHHFAYAYQKWRNASSNGDTELASSIAFILWSIYPSEAEARSVPKSTRFVSVADRGTWFNLRFPRPTAYASVCIAVTTSPTGLPESILVSERPKINGHTGKPMTYGGQTVLFGGSVERGETGPEAALREFIEESGLDVPPESFAYGGATASWGTESGVLVTGHVFTLPSHLLDVMSPDSREVAAVGILPIAQFESLKPTLRFDPFPSSGTASEHIWSQSAHYSATDCFDREWILWGIAGHMINALAAKARSKNLTFTAGLVRGVIENQHLSLKRLVSASATGSASTGGGAQHAFSYRVVQARRLLSEMSGPASFVYSDVLTDILGRQIVLLNDTSISIGNCSKLRSLAGSLLGIANTVRMSEPGYSAGQPRSDLDQALRQLDGKTLVTASTGSYGYTLCELAKWSGVRGYRIDVKLHIADDIEDYKLDRLRHSGAEIVLHHDFSYASTIAREESYSDESGLTIYIPSDPEDSFSEGLGFSHLDGTAGFATVLLDIFRYMSAPSPLRDVENLDVSIPTSGGATWVSNLLLLHCLKSDPTISHSLPTSMTCIYDFASPTVVNELRERPIGRAPSMKTDVAWSHAVNGLAQTAVAPAFPALYDQVGKPAVGASSYAGVDIASCVTAKQILSIAENITCQTAGAATLASAVLDAVQLDHTVVQRLRSAELVTAEQARSLYARSHGRSAGTSGGTTGARILLVSG